jgi:glucitol operon activator protein
MDFVRNSLFALALLWAVQLVGSWYQMRHYRDTVRTTVARWQSGFLGVGSRKASFRRGAIVILVLSSEMRIAQFSCMSGLTVLSRFRSYPRFLDMSIEQFNASLKAARLGSSITRAAADALASAQGAAAEGAEGDRNAARAAPPELEEFGAPQSHPA